MDFKPKDIKIFMDKVEFEPNTGCWIWRGATSRGYGYTYHSGKMHRAHRFSFSIFKRDLKLDEIVLHKCDTTQCVNPDHLLAGTQSENMYDSSHKKRHKNSKKEFCPKGHPLSGENLKIHKRKGGLIKSRECKICYNESQRRWYNRSRGNN